MRTANEILQDIVDWWDEWNASDEPHEMEDPPIEEARQLLKQTSSRDDSEEKYFRNNTFNGANLD